MALTAIIGPVVPTQEYDIGSLITGPSPRASTLGFLFHEDGEPVMDSTGVAVYLRCEVPMYGSDATSGLIRSRLEANAADLAQTQFGITDDITFVWTHDI